MGLREFILKTSRAAGRGTLGRGADALERDGAERFGRDVRAQMRARLRSSRYLARQVRSGDDAVTTTPNAARLIDRLERGGVRRAGDGGPVLQGELARQGRIGSVRALIAANPRGRFVATLRTKYGARRAVWERGLGGRLKALVVFADRGTYDRRLDLDPLRERARRRAVDRARALVDRVLD